MKQKREIKALLVFSISILLLSVISVSFVIGQTGSSIPGDSPGGGGVSNDLWEKGDEDGDGIQDVTPYKDDPSKWDLGSDEQVKRISEKGIKEANFEQMQKVWERTTNEKKADMLEKNIGYPEGSINENALTNTKLNEISGQKYIEQISNHEARVPLDPQNTKNVGATPDGQGAYAENANGDGSVELYQGQLDTTGVDNPYASQYASQNPTCAPCQAGQPPGGDSRFSGGGGTGGGGGGAGSGGGSGGGGGGAGNELLQGFQNAWGMISGFLGELGKALTPGEGKTKAGGSPDGGTQFALDDGAQMMDEEGNMFAQNDPNQPGTIDDEEDPKPGTQVSIENIAMTVPEQAQILEGSDGEPTDVSLDGIPGNAEPFTSSPELLSSTETKGSDILTAAFLPITGMQIIEIPKNNIELLRHDLLTEGKNNEIIMLKTFNEIHGRGDNLWLHNGFVRTAFMQDKLMYERKPVRPYYQIKSLSNDFDYDNEYEVRNYNDNKYWLIEKSGERFSLGNSIINHPNPKIRTGLFSAELIIPASVKAKIRNRLTKKEYLDIIINSPKKELVLTPHLDIPRVKLKNILAEFFHETSTYETSEARNILNSLDSMVILERGEKITFQILDDKAYVKVGGIDIEFDDPTTIDKIIKLYLQKTPRRILNNYWNKYFDTQF